MSLASGGQPLALRVRGNGQVDAFASDIGPAPAHTVISALTQLLGSFGAGLEDDAALLALGGPAIVPLTPPATNTPR
ncbi:hypothetical protein ABZX69_25850 [Streptomyces sp. NPDC004074]|uniref:hypothetical protein n=1 Tax=Streptomyces sp. NPDC004074 TaxID=3154277 RepID=UPI0033BB5A17